MSTYFEYWQEQKLRKICAVKAPRRKEILDALGWPTDGLDPEAVWSLWLDVLRLLYRDHSLKAIERLVGIADRSLKADMDAGGIVLRKRGSGRRGPDPTSLRQRAIAAGKNPFTVYGRVAKGMTEARALAA